MLQVNVTSQYVSLDHSLSNTRQYFGQNNRKSLLKKAVDGWNRKQSNCEVRYFIVIESKQGVVDMDLSYCLIICFDSLTFCLYNNNK